MSDKDYEVKITEEELEILNQALGDYIMGLETEDGFQSEVDKVEALQGKLNREKNIRQDLLDASEDDSCEHCDLEDCPAQCLESLGARRASDRGDSPVEFTESHRGEGARDQWARAYEDLNGAPESDDDR
jgi:hypothetical protein